MRMVWPVMREAAELARKMAAPATSIGQPMEVERGDAFNDISAEGRIAESGIGAGSFDESGSDGVDGDVVCTPFDGEAFGEVRYPSFGHAIDGLSGKRREPGLRKQQRRRNQRRQRPRRGAGREG